jgi:hypothetical protein
VTPVVAHGVACVVQVPALAGERWKTTVLTPEPASAELLTRAIDPRTFAPPAGEVTEPVGFVLSIRRLATTLVLVLPTLSVASAAQVVRGHRFRASCRSSPRSRRPRRVGGERRPGAGAAGERWNATDGARVGVAGGCREADRAAQVRAGIGERRRRPLVSATIVYEPLVRHDPAGSRPVTVRPVAGAVVVPLKV